MREGKVPPELLDRFLRGLPSDDRLLIGPGIGRDAAVIDLGDRALVLTSDPVSFTAERAGWYAVHVSANDVACLGAEPRWFLATILLPLTSDEDDVAAIFADLRAACDAVGAILVGGHTEVTSAVAQVIVIGTMAGEVRHDRLRRSDAAQPGDALLQLGSAAIEGTALLAREAPERLAAAGVSEATVSAAAALLFDPGISVLPVARMAWTLPGLHALHDPTEGGITTGCWEIAQAAGLGVVVDASRVLLHSLTRQVCGALAADPMGLLASGSLLITVASAHADAALRQLRSAGVETAQIGHLSQPGDPAILVQDGGVAPLPRFEPDEVARILARES